MAAIKQLIKINAPIQAVYDAITTSDGVQGWWFPFAEIDTSIGGISRLGKNKEDSLFLLKTVEVEPGKMLEWKCLEGPSAWRDTEITFTLVEEGDSTLLKLAHWNWRSKGEIFHVCSFDWAMYLGALRNYLETGAIQIGLGQVRLSMSAV